MSPHQHTPPESQTDPDLDFDDVATTPPKTLPHPSYEELEAKLNEVEAQFNEANTALNEAKNQLLRQRAEVDNIQKRGQKDIQNAHKYGLERLISELLPVI